MADAKRKLKGIHFDFGGAEVSYTDASQGGACSGHNDPFLLKAKQEMRPLTEEQEQLLADIGEEPTALIKTVNDEETNAPSSSETEGTLGEETKLKKGNDDMSQETLDKIAKLEKQLRASEAKNELQGFGFDKELTAELANTLSDLDEAGVATVVKALEKVKADADAKLDKAKEKLEASEENGLGNLLDKEAGDGGETEQEVKKDYKELSLVEQIEKHQNGEFKKTK